jgi:flagellar biosynthesis/type III secretory pathway M-ring protein FliF/YscJ
LIFKFFVKKPKPTVAMPAGAYAAGQAVAMTDGEPGSPENAVSDVDLTDLMLQKSSEAEKIEELMDRYPETVAQILRTWLAEDN